MTTKHIGVLEMRPGMVYKRDYDLAWKLCLGVDLVVDPAHVRVRLMRIDGRLGEQSYFDQTSVEILA